MKLYLLTLADGSVSVMRLLGDSTFEVEVAKWDAVAQATVASFKEITEEEIPKDRTFRNAWSSDPDGSLKVDMAKARNIWRDKIRAARAPLLADLDAEYMRALEAKNEVLQSVAASKKQALRDLPQDPRIESAQTPEELRSVWVEELNEGADKARKEGKK